MSERKLLAAGDPDAWKDGPTVTVHEQWRNTLHGLEYRRWFAGEDPPEWVRWHGERPFTIMRYPADPIMLTNLEVGEIE